MRKSALLPLSIVFVASIAVPCLADTDADRTAIRETALDYAEGWYAGDPERMEQALHPDLAKRIVRAADGQYRLEPMSAMGLVQATRTGWGTRTPESQQQKDVEILDLHGDIASVKLTMRDWVDYMHLARWNGRWVIVNVLWDLKPETRTAPGS